ncbi:MAG TPA: M48 family metallopeptidase [Propionibacteriaceae bacterium]|nr:M48 family metallopeptidase [Propionibacteriaceae bacterium]
MTSGTTDRTVLYGISSRAWEHPADRGALVALRKLRGFDTVVKRLSSFITERAVRLMLLGSAVRVDSRQFSRVFRIYTEAATVLDVERVPELYVAANPFLNAQTIGLDRPVIVINSAMLDTLDDDELRFVLGHELGHVGSGHAVYRTVLLLLTALSTTLLAIPLGGLALRAIMAALWEWARKSELSGDRAGLLACQDPDAALRVHMKLASGGDTSQLDAEAFLDQADAYHEDEDIRDLLLRALVVETMSHPFAVARAGELRRWVTSGEYALVLAGSYPRREDDAKADLSAETVAAAASYGDQFAKAEQTIDRFFRDLTGGLGSVGSRVTDFFRGPAQSTRRNDGEDDATPSW